MTSPAPGGTYPLAGKDIPRIGYGMGQLARRAAESDDARADAITLLHKAFDLGVRHFDTAQFYGAGLANRMLDEAFGSLRDQVVFATKAGARPVDEPVPLTAAQRPRELREAVEANLTSLNTDRIDLVYLRRMDFEPGLIAEGEQQVPLDDQLAELTALRDEGKVVAIGLSHVTLDQFHAAAGAGVAAVQNIYNLLDRSFEDLLDACRQTGAAWAPYFPLGGGGQYAGLPKVTEDPVVEAVAQELDATPTQVGLAWQLAHATNALLVPGTGSIDHLEENVAAGSLQLDDQVIHRLENRTA